jgi:hypothetical protein
MMAPCSANCRRSRNTVQSRSSKMQVEGQWVCPARWIQSMDLACETKKQSFWQHGGTILVDSQAATIKGHCDMWLNWLPILHRHTSCGSPIMHGCTNSRLHIFCQGTAEPYQICATLKDPVLNAKVCTQQAMLAHCCPTRLQQILSPL